MAKKKHEQIPLREDGKLDLLGTAEAAEVLDVERPRIGRWRQRGVMPEPVAVVRATPLWTREQVESVRPTRDARRWSPDRE